jgi:transcriptional regulator with XRE-family HTH domain
MSSCKVGKIIRERREILKYSLRSLAREVGISSSYLSFIERSMNKTPPSEKVLLKLERILAFPKYFLLIKSKRLPVRIEKIILSDPSYFVLIEKCKGLSPKSIQYLSQIVEKQSFWLEVSGSKYTIATTL